MARPLRLAFSMVLAGCSVLAGCGASAPPATPPPPTTLTVADPTTADGARAMEPVCFETERCDALDADCDGRIDEGCDGAPGSDALAVGLAWSDGARLAVEVAPAGLRAEAPATDCEERPGPPAPLYLAGALGPGEHRVTVARLERCGEPATHASVSVAFAGRALGVYVVEVGDAPADVLRFTVRAE